MTTWTLASLAYALLLIAVWLVAEWRAGRGLTTEGGRG